jgi:hypothetical protein
MATSPILGIPLQQVSSRTLLEVLEQELEGVCAIFWIHRVKLI